MLRNITVISLIIAFAAQTISGAVVSFGYYINPDTFAKNCVNKARPTLHCNGKCQMMKKIKEEGKKEQENQERKTDNKITVLSSRSFFATIIAVNIQYKITYPVTGCPAAVHRSSAVFHPPLV